MNLRDTQASSNHYLNPWPDEPPEMKAALSLFAFIMILNPRHFVVQNDRSGGFVTRVSRLRQNLILQDFLNRIAPAGQALP
jgi:hypothetical protein